MRQRRGAWAFIHTALAACTTDHVFLSGERDARAETPPGALGTVAACKQWEVKSFLPKAYVFTTVGYRNPDSTGSNIDIPTFEAFSLPEGWEPFTAEGYGATVARRCVSQ